MRFIFCQFHVAFSILEHIQLRQSAVRRQETQVKRVRSEGKVAAKIAIFWVKLLQHITTRKTSNLQADPHHSSTAT